MQTEFVLRQLHANDGPAYAKLVAESPDTGRVSTAVHFEIDAYQALTGLHMDVVGVVAEAPGYDGLAGGGLLRFGQCQFEGHLRPYALLNTLVVHPGFRRRGLASKLAQWRVDYARQHLNTDGVLLALIQQGNTGSELTARKWYRDFLTKRLAVFPIKMRTRPPQAMHSITVRPVRPSEFDQVADRMNRFYQGYNFYTPETADSLSAWLDEALFETRYHHYIVAVDAADNILAGIGLAENHRMRTVRVLNMPRSLKVLNALLKLVPADGVMRELSASRLWFAPHQLRAARFLWENVRWDFREKGTALLLSLDVNSPLIDVLNPKPWTLRSGGGIAIHGPMPVSTDRLIYYA